MRIILEGSDLVGKSTAVKLLSPYLKVEDRLLELSDNIFADGFDPEIVDRILDKNSDALFIVLVINDEKILMRRLQSRENPDKYDLKCADYNRQYRKLALYLSDRPNVVSVEVDGLNKFQKTARIFEEVLKYQDRTWVTS